MPLPQGQYLPQSARADLAGRAQDLKTGGLPELLRKAGKEMYDNPVVNTAISLTPGAGDLQSGFEAFKSAREGDWTGAGLNAVGILPFVPALAGTFVGKGSKTWDAVQAAEALKRIDSGEDAAKVWKETGYGVAPWDKMARSEIDDSTSAFMKDAASQLRNNAGRSQSQLMRHEELFGAYPESASVWTSKQAGDGSGAYSPGEMGKSDMISLGMQARGSVDMNKLMDSNLHEMQHAIQTREGFASGGDANRLGLNKAQQFAHAKDAYNSAKGFDGSPSVDDLFAELSGETVAASKAKPWDSLSDREKLSWLEAGRDRAYRRLGGEAEARLTEARKTMTAEQRRNQYPYEPKYFEEVTGVPIDQLISSNQVVEALRKTK